MRQFTCPGFAVILLSGLSATFAHASGSQEYEVTASGAKAGVGARGAAGLAIAGKNGWHLNEEAPLTVKLLPPTGMSVDKPKLGRADAAEASKDKARFAIGFTATTAGKAAIDAECSFVICQESACKPIKEKVSVPVEITALAAAPAPSPAKKLRPKKH